MDARQQELLKRQGIIAEGIRKIGVNFGKDGPDRKTTTYIRGRLDTLQAHWNEFEMNHGVLQGATDRTDTYYATKVYDRVKAEYASIQHKLQTWPTCTAEPAGHQGEENKNTGVLSKSDELKTQQSTNFRAFSRFTSNLCTADIIEKWDIEDKLRILESRWRVIDEVHWQLDNILVGSDVNYELEFSRYEETYECTKRDLNRKRNLAVQQRDSAPRIEIPIFSGNYAQWPTFLDLYIAAIHNNPSLSKGQKMQHLKGKLKGEAERLVQHLSVSESNYDSCWEILHHRYNNLQLLFTKQMQVLMSQHTTQHQNAYELKRLHDTSLETVHALRNLGIDTSTWDPILVHILTGKLDTQTYSDYMEARKSPRGLPDFKEFIQFIEGKFTALESVAKKTSKPNKQTDADAPPNKGSSTTTVPREAYNRYRRYPKTNHTSSDRNCPVCKTSHILLHCKAFQEMAPDIKIRRIEQLNICKNCMYPHNGKKCNSQKRCKVCNGAHHTTLHDLTPLTLTDMTLSSSQLTDNVTNNNSQRKSNHVSGNFKEVLLATVQLKVKAADGTYTVLRCLLDQGSQLNLITESAVQRLGLPRRNQNSTVSGIGTFASQSNGTVQLDCKSLYGDYEFSTPALVMAKLLNNLPNYSFEKQDWPHIENINLADPQFNLSRPIDILLDAGVYGDIVMSSIIRGNIYAPIAQQTKLGWVLVGNTNTFNCHVVVDTNDISRFWEIEEITTDGKSTSIEEEYCERLYTDTTKRLEDGRYEVRIPMRMNFEQNLGRSKPQAVAQFKQLEKRLARDETLASSYKAFIDEYKALQHMKKCAEPDTPSCFLPHHGVMRPDSTTTKLRVVFNASATTSTGHSLNQLMECGPNLQQDLQAIILRWRAFEYVYTADIEKFYRQIRIQEKDQHLQKIVWRDSVTEPLQELQLTTVTYGTKSAPFLAMRTVKQLVKDDGVRYPLAAAILSNQLYMDDLLGGCHDFITAQKAQGELITMLKGGGFNLRKWASNKTRLLEDLSDELISQKMFNFKDADTNKTLGITWNPRTDQFTYKQIALCNKRDVNTKRTLLSDISKLYDPLGWLSPVTVKAKLIFQHAWSATTSWDDQLPPNIQQEWEQFRNQLAHIHDIAIPRWVGDTQQSFELHGFCDASERAYGCVIYCKSTDKEGQQLIRLVAAKTKLAPQKTPISLPRLELCGAVLLARLMEKVRNSINSQTVTIHCWTDSMVVLGWLHGDVGRWKSFVANRVTEIIQITPSNSWKHVKSEDNPADCASRGISPSDLISHELWWKAPSWLQNNDIPKQGIFTTNEEKRKRGQTCAIQTTHAPLIEQLLQKYSSMTYSTRVISWVIRFINNSRDATTANRRSHLSTEDIEQTQNLLVKTTQNNTFGDEIAYLHKHNKVRATSKLLSLSPILDAQGILRVGGRLQHAKLSNSQKHPIILPNNHKLSELLIDQAHKSTLHGGARLTLGHLRNKYWILGGMKPIKKQLNKCVTCHRYKTQRSNQQMADLPTPRVTPSRPFTHTGVDFTGHVEIKANKGRGIKTVKAYIAIFICLCTKAIHLELVSDLSTVTFLAALKRLCARRGTPKHIYSDNGTNFVGAARALAKERQEAIQLLVHDDLINSTSESGIEWHFNAPSWPTAGGLWEAAVKSMKHHLKRVLGEQRLTYEEFTTLLVQIEACLNSRPLVALTNDLDDIDYLTPGHFLVGGPVLAPPMTSEADNSQLTLRWRLTENMYKEFWKKWSNDYLQTLQLRGKWQTPTHNIAVDDVVLIKEEQVAPARWLLGRVIETHPGPDNLVRVVTLKTKSNIMKRPVTKLSRLPVETGMTTDNKTTQPTDNKQTTPTTAQRQRRVSHRQERRGVSNCNVLKYLSTLLILMVTCATPSMQQLVNVTTLDPTRLVYFDKAADLQIIQDEWRLVVYYNMSTYWKSISAVDQYVQQLHGLCQRNIAYLTISTQLEHELNELKHYNEVLQSDHGRRRKRGLINGIGNIANSLFGVLDDKFAEKYNNDIKLLHSNEDHLLNLYKQHTSIIEGEYNLLKRNEQVMNRQFIVINKSLRESLQQLKTEQDQATFLTATALAANMMVANLRRIQDTLINLVTDLRHGKVDTHLLKPDAFEKQLNIISGQIPKGLSLPCSNKFKCIREMYKLASVQGKITEDFIIFEVKIPLVADEQYELTEVIPIRNIKGASMVNIIPTTKYIAVNLKMDMMIPLDQQHLSSCTQVNTNQLLLCNLDLPIYGIKTATKMCEADIINNRGVSTCRTEVSSCSNEWKKLHSKGAWLFTCCEECTMRIFCPAGITSQTLQNTGIITLGTGCMMRGDKHLIHSHYNMQSTMELGNEQEIYVPEINLNELLTSNSQITNITNMEIETHEEQLKGLKRKIELIKEQQDIQLVNAVETEQHHYVLYGCMITCATVFSIWVYFQIKVRCLRLLQGNRTATQAHKEEIEMVPSHTQEDPPREGQTKAETPALEAGTGHLPNGNKVDRETSPISVSGERRTF